MCWTAFDQFLTSPPPQIQTWTAFKEAWDNARRHTEDAEWGLHFAQETKKILDDIYHGQDDVLSKWMEEERRRVLSDEGCLLVPAINFV